MTRYEIAYKKLLKRGFYASEISADKLHYIISANYKGWANLSDKSMDFIAFNVCKSW